MDPCPFLRILIGNLSLNHPHSSSKPLHSFCNIKLHPFPSQQTSLSPTTTTPTTHHHDNSISACFNLHTNQIDKFSNKPQILKIDVYIASEGLTTSCVGTGSTKLLGRLQLPLGLSGVDSKPSIIHNGWIPIDKSSNSQLHLTVRAEPDPRFVFQFGGEPECSPQVFQVQGSLKQAVFTSKFGFRNQSVVDRSTVSRSVSWPLMSEDKTTMTCLPSFGSDKDPNSKERKGWSITIHDLSGSPVAMASMVTPFVPSPGSDRVSRSNPGAWLILRPGNCTWKPWGRLEAWREPGNSDAIGYRFDLLHDATSAATTTIVNSTVSSKKGGKFTIDTTTSLSTTPVHSPHSSCDFGSGSWPTPGSRSGSGSGSDFMFCTGMYRGFVMSSTVGKRSKPEVEIGVQHVTCTEDAAAYVALAAAMDLSMDACKLFSQKLRKELRQKQSQLSGVGVV